MSGTSHSTSRGIPWIGLCLGFAVVAAAAVIWRAWSEEFAPNHSASSYRIASGSMAPALRGPHWQIPCGDCRYLYRSDQAMTPSDERTTCPLCGHSQSDSLNNATFQNGQRVRIVRSDSLARGDVVAFKRQSDNAPQTKRILGLPGETIRIAKGDLAANGKIIAKDLEAFFRTAVLVHDSVFQASTASRWNPTLNSTSWSRKESGFQFEPVGSPGDPDWMEYQHWRGFASPRPRDDPSPVLDHYQENQSLSRTLHRVDDLVLEVNAMMSSEATLRLRLLARGVVVEAAWSAADSEVRVFANSVLVDAAPWKRTTQGDSERFALGFVDGRLLVGANRTLVWTGPAPAPDAASEAATAAIESGRVAAFSADGGEVHVRRVVLYRDLHYLEPNLTAKPWTITLGPEEFLLLGDNVPIAVDSRRFGAVLRTDILGQVAPLADGSR